MALPLQAKVGQTLDERFLLTEELGRGGMSTIFKANDLQNQDKPVVVKVALPAFSSGVGAWSMFQREEEIARQLDHPYILKFLPLDTGKRRPYMVTELVPGITLADRLALQSPLPEAEALSIASKVCEALEHVHEHGVVHYDLKPGNVMVCPDGTIRLIDFGLAHTAVTARFTLSGGVPPIGSSDYVAPEQIKRKRGRKSVDIYGVGTLLYEMLTGKTPFPGDDPFVVASARLLGDPPAPRTMNPAISPQVEEIVLKAVRRDPDERYPSAAAMKADLVHVEQVTVTGLSHRLQPVTRWRRTLRFARHIATWVLLPVASQVVLFLLLWHHLTRKP
ncbi:MAG TPA: serine/threonine-protein kinase [Polyangia bacterium]